MKKFSVQVRTASFTLLETIIALILISALMVVVWSVLASFTRVENRSHTTIADLEITRSIHRQLQDDMDQLLFYTDSTGTGDSHDAFPLVLRSGETMAGLDVDRQAGATIPKSSFFSGSKDKIQFLIFDRQSSNEGKTEFDEFAADSLDSYHVVTYQWQLLEDDLAELESISRDLESENSGSESDETSNQTTHQTAWVRSVQSFRDFHHFGNDSSLVQQQQLGNFETMEIGRNRSQLDSGQPTQKQLDVMDEISEIAWRYFDGHSWLASWNSSSEGVFPVAIELRFKTRSRNRSQHDVSPNTGKSFEIRGAESGSRTVADRFGQASVDAWDSSHKRILIRIGVN